MLTLLARNRTPRAMSPESLAASEAADRPPTTELMPVEKVDTRSDDLFELTGSLEVLIAAPDEMVRKVIKASLGNRANVVAEFDDGWEVVHSVHRTQPDVAIISTDLSTVGGLEIIRILAERYPETIPICVTADRSVDAVQEAMVAGARNMIFWPSDGDAIRAAYAKAVETHRSRALSAEPGSLLAHAGVWSVCSPNGGVGRTTFLLSLAYELHRRGLSAGSVDLDLYFGDMAFYLGVQRTGTMMDLLEQQNFLERRKLQDALVEHSSGLKILTGPPDPYEASTLDRAKVGLTVKGLREVVDYVLADLPSGVVSSYLPVLDDSSLIFVVTKDDISGLKNMRSFIGMIKQMNVRMERICPIVIGSKDEKRTREEFNRILSGFGTGVALILPDCPELAEKSIMSGQPISKAAPTSDYAKAITRFVDQLLAGNRKDAEDRPAKKGLLKWILG